MPAASTRRATDRSIPGLIWVLAVAGGGGYLVPMFLERRRLTTSESIARPAADRAPLRAAVV